LSGPIGNLPQVQGADIHYAQAAILTPSDIHFPRDGIAAQANENVEALIIHDLDMATLRRTRRSGSVRPWVDRRTDLYKVVFGRERDLEI
jgi:predicted amidohydrolase